MKNTLMFIFLFAALSLLNGCRKKDDTSDITLPSVSSNDNIKATLCGIVLDESNAPVSGVSVSAYSQNTTTDQNGLFILKEAAVNKDRCIIQFSKGGYFKRVHAIIPSVNTANYIKIILVGNASSHIVSSYVGGSAGLTDGSSILFQPNSFVTGSGSIYNGNVYLSVKHLLPGTADFGFKIPGGDLTGKDLANKQVALYTYGMIGVELKSSTGAALQLANGKPATLTMTISASQLASAPATIPLWYFDEVTSSWKEEGVAAKTGSTYTGTVTHFTWWNCDHPEEQAKIKGRVVDCNGIPLANLVVTLNGWATLLTDQNGIYQSWVPSSTAFDVQVVASNNSSIVLNSQVENVPSLAPNAAYSVPDLIVSCPSTIAGKIKNCSGEFADGLVRVSWNSGSVFQYALKEDSGSFSMPCAASSLVDLLAYTHVNSSVLSYAGQYQSLPAGSTFNTGSIFMCDSLAPVHLNNVTVSGGPFSNYLMTYTGSYNSNAGPDTFFNGCQIYTHGFTANYLLTCSVDISDTIPGSYFFTSAGGHNAPYLYFSNATDTFFVSNGGQFCGPGTINLLEFGPIGGRIIGNFSGISTLERTNHVGGQMPATVSGNFDVLRTH